MPENYVPRIRLQYHDEVVAALQEEFKYDNVMEIPRLVKIVVNSTSKDAVTNSKMLESVREELTLIAGQRAVITRARRSIAGFKLREGMPLGARVTLRGTRMWEFYDRLVSLAVPRLRDFRGLNPKAFDGRGNYNIGVKEQIIFPEIEYDKVDALRGLNISITTTAKTDEEAKALLAGFRFPFKN